MKTRFLGVLLLVLGLLLPPLGVPAAATPLDRDGDARPGQSDSRQTDTPQDRPELRPFRTYERPSERVLYDQRVRDGKVSADLKEARKHAAVNYAVVWWRITDYHPRTIEKLKTAANQDERYPWIVNVDPSVVHIEVMTGWQMLRKNPALFHELRQRGLKENDVIAQMIARSIPPAKDRRGRHAEEILLRLRYEFEYRQKRIEEFQAAGIEITYDVLEQIEEELRPRAKVRYTPEGLIYGVSEREPCSYRGSPGCYRYAGPMAFLVPYGEKPERRAAQGRLARIIQQMVLTMMAKYQWSAPTDAYEAATDEVALMIVRTFIRDAVTKAVRPFEWTGELPGRRYDYEDADPRQDPPGLERQNDPALEGSAVEDSALANALLGTVPRNGLGQGDPKAAGRADSSDMGNGGIDLSSLELRYLAEEPSGDGVRYAFAGRRGGSGETTDALAGARSVNNASDSFFVWLAVPESNFWVNLNPNEPDRIVGEGLDETDVGRIMLEADLQLKKTVGELIHPDTALGKRFWNSLERVDGEACFSHRLWITPEPAVIYEDDDELYILEAPLTVQTEQDYIGDVGTGEYQDCPYQPEYVEEHNMDVYKRLVMPRLIEAVNNAPEYADLRQIYLGRIAAKWYRERNEQRPMAFSDLIDSGDVEQWTTTEDWTPEKTFREYVRSYTEGEFDTGLYTYGGVLFEDVPTKSVTAAEFRRGWPEMQAAVDATNGRPATPSADDDTGATDDDSGMLWLGGSSAEPEKPRPQAKSPAPEEDVDWLRITLPVMAGLVLMIGLFFCGRGRRPAGRRRDAAPSR